uniref:Gag-pol polyprotein n=1 Tax=Solanum tuberosum TaxID=4113 RepID=M1D1A8_SOLTU
MDALVSIRSGTDLVNKHKRPYSPYSYDPNVTCDHCKRKGHSKAICFRLVGYPPDFERRRRENQVNNSDKGNYYSERGGNTYTTSNNVVNSPVKTQEQANHFSRNVDYNKGM